MIYSTGLIKETKLIFQIYSSFYIARCITLTTKTGVPFLAGFCQLAQLCMYIVHTTQANILSLGRYCGRRSRIRKPTNSLESTTYKLLSCELTPINQYYYRPIIIAHILRIVASCVEGSTLVKNNSIYSDISISIFLNNIHPQMYCNFNAIRFIF